MPTRKDSRSQKFPQRAANNQQHANGPMISRISRNAGPSRNVIPLAENGDGVDSRRRDAIPSPEASQPKKREKTKILGTVEDLARRWRCSPKTIRNNISSGRLKLGTKILGRRRFDIEEVLEYERENRIAAKDARAPTTPRRGGAK
jgi:hypothetical protein